MSKKYFVQPTGSWGIIMWSFALSILCLGVVLQLEVFSFSILPFLAWILGIALVIYIITNSWVKFDNGSVIIKEPNYYKARVFDQSEVKLKNDSKWTLEFIFENHDYFPLKITSTKKILKKIKKEAGDANVISK
ncbi:EbsA family protein [Companilactobacillus jidongensis]|uniref:EbsA family protein n=1 Tax=Companilactobacillus jidongensis TaxID=2486006 RepID=UPI000F799A21|nr:EbsA family protein [Companilactobacillus jidongensis]